ncbi:MAG: DUF4296 domain-containing protein [Ignavibacteriales bacterium]|nr:MAG: DUF4296 domain-containing protein [Ignavibacteriales bacterium]
MSFNSHSTLIHRHSIVKSKQPGCRNLKYTGIKFLHTLIILFYLFQVSGCEQSNYIEQDKLVLVYTDLLIAQDTTSTSDINPDSLRNSILNRHGVTEDAYEQTLNYYNEEEGRWDDFFNKVTAHIESLKEKAD